MADEPSSSRPMSRSHVLEYAVIFFAVAAAAWSTFPYITVTSAYLASCLVFLAYGRKKPALQVATVNRSNRDRAVSLCLGLVNTAIWDACLWYFVRDSKSHGPLYTLAGWPGVVSLAYMYYSPLVVMALQDAWFYHLHRFCHSNKTLFRYVHYLHHEKSQPEAADLFFMHPLEALAVVAMPSLVLPYVVPLHWFIFEGWIVFSILIDVYGHLNFDAAPFHPFKISPYSHVRRLPWKKIFLQGRHHNAHHKLMRGNFALYFTFWDQFCQTRIED